MEKVSIVIPIYNATTTLHRCLDSVIHQTYKNIEIICVNDGSTDNSLEIMQQYAIKDNRIKIINQSKNMGATYTKNNGISNATGDYISFIDSDDYAEINMIEKMLHFAVENNLDLVRCHYNNHIANKLENTHLNYPEKAILTTAKEKDKFINELLSGTIPGYLQLLLLKRKHLLTTDLKIDANINFLEDLLFIITYIDNRTKIGILNERLFNYVNNREGLTFSLKYEKIMNRLNGIIYFNSKLKQNKKLSPFQLKILDTRCTYLLIHSMYELWLKKHNSDIPMIYKNNNLIFKNCSIADLDRFSKGAFKLLSVSHYSMLNAWFLLTKVYTKIKGVFK